MLVVPGFNFSFPCEPIRLGAGAGEARRAAVKRRWTVGPAPTHLPAYFGQPHPSRVGQREPPRSAASPHRHFWEGMARDRHAYFLAAGVTVRLTRPPLRSNHDHHGLPDLHRVHGVGVSIDVGDFDAGKFHDDIAIPEARLIRWPAPA